MTKKKYNMSIKGVFTNTLRGKHIHIEINQLQHDQLVEEVTALATARNLCVTRALLPFGQKHRRHWVVIKLDKSSRMSDFYELLGNQVDITYRLTADETVNIMLQNMVPHVTLRACLGLIPIVARYDLD